jgi:hypothetical protein
MILSLLATVVDAECACAKRCDLKQAAGHHQFLMKWDVSFGSAKFAWKNTAVATQNNARTLAAARFCSL